MGGFGSGRWYRCSGASTDDVKSIDIRLLRKWGYLPNERHFAGSRYGSLTWSRGDAQTGSVSYVIHKDRLILSFRYQWASDPWQDVEQTVWFDRTTCNLGGERLWFFCPHCEVRVVVIYLGRYGFLCRHCYQLPYSSQRETYTQRMNRKARRIRERLEGSCNLFEPVWCKPKGMHWTTFERLCERERSINNLGMWAWLEKANSALERSEQKTSGKRSRRGNAGS
jgi:hypothetical protein